MRPDESPPGGSGNTTRVMGNKNMRRKESWAGTQVRCGQQQGGEPEDVYVDVMDGRTDRREAWPQVRGPPINNHDSKVQLLLH